MSEGSHNRAFRILLVEDNPGDVYLLRRALKDAELNAELTVIDDGAEALAFARGQGKYAAVSVPDLAVLDLNLPKNDGAAVLEAMRQNQRLSHVPVAIMTSAAPPEDQTKVEKLGIGRFITKPPHLDDFLRIGEMLKEMLLERKTGNAPTGSASVPEEQ